MAAPSDMSARPRRALVTGISGFTGRYVAAELERAGYEVIGLTHAGGARVANVHPVDLCDREAMLSLVSGMELDTVVHLAAISFVAHGDADAIYRTNVVGTRNLLEALARASAPPRVVVLASSANVYGNADVEPITEDTPAAPVNDYAVSKLAMEHMARLWMDRLPIVITRPFNYTGVGQAEHFLVPKIVSHYQRRASEIELGNIEVVRDFLDVRDVASAYRRIVDSAPAGKTFNICSGRGHSLGYVVHTLADIAGYEIAVQVNPDFIRANEIKRLVGSPQELVSNIGMHRILPFEMTLRWMYESGRNLDSSS